MKVRISSFFLLVFLLTAFGVDARQYALIIVDETNGAILHAENPDMRTYPASLAKIMTLYLVFEKLSSGELELNQRLQVSARAARRPPSKLGLKRGQKIRVKDAINALITKSANDVATVVAEAISGTETRFASLMTKRARDLGMNATTFKNASGLPHRKQVTTARDMARLSISIWRDFPQYFSLFSQKTFKFGRRKFRNHNNLLRRYKGTNGIKTGFINSSGYNLAVSIQRNGRRLVGVIFGGKTTARRDNKMIRLLRRTMKMMSRHDQMVKNNALALS
ncbi:MAG: D-alanyl-D-alanine carboxypeptidase family protein, partial [Rhodospirillaceae bacterium]